MKKIILYTLFLILIASCKKDEIMFFEGKDAISIYIGQYEADSISYSFASRLPAVTRDTLFIKLRVQGPARATDRVVQLAPDSGTTAVSGIDYILPELVLPADSIQALYPVILLRNAQLQNRTQNLNVMVKASDKFEIGAVGEVINKSITIARYKIKFNDFISKPSYWSDIEWAIGEFSVTKLQFMFTVYGADTDFGNLSTGELLNMRLRLRTAQKEYEVVNGPLLDENGNQVIF